MTNCSQASRIERRKRLRKEVELKENNRYRWKRPTVKDIFYAKDKIMQELN